MSESRIAQIKVMLKEQPKDSFLHFALAKEYEKLEDLNQALVEYEFIRKEDPSYIGNYFHLGKCYEELDETEKALQAYTDGIVKGQELGDLHAVSELQNARTNLELGI